MNRNRNLLLSFTAGTFYAALSMYLMIPAEVAAQSPAQGPPAASATAQRVTEDNITAALMNIIQPAVDAENAALAQDPNFHALIRVAPIGSFPYMGQTGSLVQPNQFFADVPYSIIYYVSNISVKVAGVFVSYPGTSVIGQDLDLRATCNGWFTGKGALTYSALPGQAGYVGDTNFPNPQVGVLLQQIIPTFVNNVVNAKVASYPAGAQTVDNGAACRSLGTLPTVVIFVANDQPQDSPPNSITFDPPGFVSPITTVLNSVTVTVTSIRRLQLHSFNGQPVYNAVETPELDFFAGFTHLHIQLPAMSEGQTFVPTSDNVATTRVPLQSGTLVLLGVMNYEGLTHEDSAFVTFSRSLDFGAGAHTFDTPKQLPEKLVLGGKPIIGNGPAYEITVEISAPPVQTVLQ